MTYEEMVKLNIDTKMSKADLVEMMCEDMAEKIEGGIKNLEDELVAIKQNIEMAKDAYVSALVKSLKLSVEKGSQIKVADTDDLKHSKTQLDELIRLKDEFEAVPTIERSNSWRSSPSFPYAYDSSREKYEVPTKYRVELEEKKEINSGMIDNISTQKVLTIKLTEGAVKDLSKIVRDRVFTKKVIECRIAIEKKKLDSVTKAAPRFRAQITRKILESTPDGQKVIEMLNGVSRKLNNPKAIAEK